MTQEIGKLSVSLSLEDSQFNTSVSGINRSLKTLGAELAAMKAKGSAWGNSIEGLSQKQNALGRTLSVQEAKVKQLRDAYERSAAETGQYSEQTQRLAQSLNRAVSQFNRTEAELKGVTSELERQQAELAQSSSKWSQLQEKMSNVGTRLQGVGQGMRNVGQSLALGLTAPLLAVGAASVKTAADFEGQMSRVGAISGATSDELEKLRQSALDLGASSSKSASEVAIAQENLAALGFTANDILSAMPGVISAAEASGADMALTAETMASALNIFGLEASESTRVADILAQTANQSAADINDMSYALKYAGPVAANLGVSMEELSASIGIMTDAGLDGSSAGTALRAGLLALLKPSEENSKKMDALGISMTDANGKFVGIEGVIKNLNDSMKGMTDTQKTATLAALVGTEASSGFLALMKAGPSEIDKMTTALENSEGASAKTAKTMKENLKGSLEELGGSLETLKITVGNALAPTVLALAEKLQKLAEWFTNLSPEAQKTTLALAGIAAAIGPLLIAFGAMASAIGSLMTTYGAISLAITNAGGAAAALGAVFTALTGPIGLTVLALGALGIGAYKVAQEMKQPALEAEIFGDKVSESTQKAVGAYLELDEQATVALNQLSWSQQTVTGEMASQLIQTYSQMGDQILTEMQTDHAAQLEQTKTFFAQSNVLSKEEEAKIVQNVQTSQEEQQQKVTEGQARIAEILNTAKEQKRAITEAEKTEINKIQESMKVQAVKVMSESEAEQKAILEKLKTEATKISAEQAAAVVKNSKKQKDEVVKEANDQYTKSVAEIIRMRDESKTISADQANKLIAEAKKQRDGTIKNAEETHDKVVSEAQAQATEHVDKVNWETGQIKTKWQVMKTDIGNKMDEIRSYAKTGWDYISSQTSKKASEMKQAASDKFNEMKTAVSNKMDEVKSSIETKWNNAKSFLTNIDLSSVGRDIVQGLVNGIRNKFEDVRKAASELAEKVKGAITGAMDINSPSKVTTQYGEWTGEGFANGISKSSKKAEAKAKAMAKSVSDAIKNAEVKFDTNKINADQYISALKRIDAQHKLTAEQSRKIQSEIYAATQAKAKESAAEAKIAADFYSKLDKLNDDYVAKVRATRDQLKATEKALTDEYKKELADRKAALINFASIFDEITPKTDVSGDKLIANLGTQVDALKQYATSINALKGRGLSQALLEELENQGPKAAAEIAALASLNDAQLAEYQRLYDEKTRIASVQASKEMVEEKAELARKIEAERKKAEQTVLSYKNEWLKQINALKAETVKTMGELTPGMQNAGKNAIKGMIEGMKAMKGPLLEEAQALAAAVEKTIKTALKIKSPSRLMRDEVGKMIPAGVAIGIEGNMGVVAKAAQSLARVASSSQMSSVVPSSTSTRNYNNSAVINVYSPSANPIEIQRAQRQEQRRLAADWGV